jgi:ABC-2 type transport system ATP-binding protein
MEDIRHLCKRILVVNGGRKIFDGPLDSLLETYNEYKTISVSFESETDLQLGYEVEWIGKGPYRAAFKVRRELVRQVLQTVLNDYEVDDLKLEEEDIAEVVEKIYRTGVVA